MWSLLNYSANNKSHWNYSTSLIGLSPWVNFEGKFNFLLTFGMKDKRMCKNRCKKKYLLALENFMIYDLEIEFRLNKTMKCEIFL